MDVNGAMSVSARGKMPVGQFQGQAAQLTLVRKLARERRRDARTQTVADDDDVVLRLSVFASALSDPVPCRARVRDQASLRGHARRVRVASVVDRDYVAVVSYLSALVSSPVKSRGHLDVAPDAGTGGARRGLMVSFDDETSLAHISVVVDNRRALRHRFVEESFRERAAGREWILGAVH